MKRKRIVFLVTHGVTANRLMRGQLAFLRERGFDITVIASPGNDLDVVREREGVNVEGIEMSRKVRLHEGPLALARIVRALARIAPDVVNASTPKAGLLGMLAARTLRIKKRIFLLRGLRFEGFDGAARSILKRADQLAAACATDVVCVSASVAKSVASDRIAAPKKVSVIPSNGIDPERFIGRKASREVAANVRRELRIPAEAFVVGFVGRFVADKGIADIVDAVESIPTLHAVLVGGDLAGDALPPSLANRLQSHPRIAVVGRVENPAPYYAAMDVLLFPSQREGLPNVPLEAAACEVPTVGYRVTGVIDAVTDARTGILVDRGDRTGLRTALRRYAESPALRAGDGARARQRVIDHFTQQATWTKWAALYES